MPWNVSLRRLLKLLALAGALAARAGSAFEIEQLTCLAPGCFFTETPHLTGDGRQVLFHSRCDLDAGRNPHGTEQVFRLDLATRRIEQLTPPAIAWARKRGLDRCSFEVAADATGARVVIGAACSRESRSRQQLLEYRGRPGVLRPLGPPLPCGMRFALSADGQHLAVSSSCHPARGRRSAPDAEHAQLYFADSPGARLKRFRRPAEACRITYPQLSRDGQVAVVSSQCALSTADVPDGLLHHFRLDRRTAAAERVNPPGCIVSTVPTPFALIDPPTLSADGQSVAFVAGACGPSVEFHGRSNVFRRRPGADLEQLTFGFCGIDAAPGSGITTTLAPVAMSENGGTLAFSVWCDEPPVFRDVVDHLFVYRDGAEPRLVELFAAPEVHDYGFMSPVSMDLAGSSLVVSAPGIPGGCPSGGGNQLYLVRNLEAPAPGPVTCACGPPLR